MGQVLITKRVPQVNWLTAILLEKGLIRKSAGIAFTRKGHEADEMPMTWGPEEILNPPEKHPWYDKGPDGDWVSDVPGMRAHHPVYGYNPKTGELMFNKDGTPLGKHPIDAVAHDLQRMFDASHWTVDAKAMLQHSIEDYNDEHHEDNRVPNFYNMAWRRAVAIPFQSKSNQIDLNRLNYAKPTEEGGPRRFGTYHTNSGNVDAPGAHTGTWIDSGALPIHKHLGARLEQAEQKYGPLSRISSTTGQVKPQSVSELAYVKRHYVDLNLIGRDENYQPTVKRDSQHSQGEKHFRRRPAVHAGNIDAVTEQEENIHAIISSISIAGHAPKTLLSVRRNKDNSLAAKQGRGGKGRRGAAIEALQGIMHPETGEPIIGGDSWDNPEFGQHLTEEELNIFANSQLSNTLFGKPGQGAPNTMLNAFGKELGIDERSEEYLKQLRKTVAAGNAHGGGGGRATFGQRWITMAQMAGDDWGKHDYIHDKLDKNSRNTSGYVYSDDDAALLNKIIGHIQVGWGITPHDLASELPEREPTIPHSTYQHHEHPEHWTPRVANDLDMHIPGSDAAPVQDKGDYGDEHWGVDPPSRAPPLPAGLPSWGTRAPTAAETQLRENMRTFTPAQMQQQQGWSKVAFPEGFADRQRADLVQEGFHPNQTYFGQPLSGGGPMDWVNQAYLKSRDDVVSAMGEIQKAMEEIQIEQALEDNEVMKHVPSDISSPTTVGLFAKSMGLTSHDLYAINSTQGDWGKVAQKWNVNLKTVNVVKATFRGC